MLALTRDAANRIDDYLIHTVGIPRDILIEHAASGVVRACVAFLESKTKEGLSCKVHVFAGKGMNGSDAFACARLLYARGYPVFLWEVIASVGDGGAWHRIACERLGIPVRPAKDYQADGKSLVVDGIFGTAFKTDRSFSPELDDLFQKINNGHTSGDHVIAVDLPSGVDPDTGLAVRNAIVADETVTFLRPKTGIITYPGRKYAGRIHVEPIGLPSLMVDGILAEIEARTGLLPEVLDREEARIRIPKRPVDGHKGTFGKAGLIGGSSGMAGSICLAAMAAMRCGTGLTAVRVPRRIEADCLAVIPEALISDNYDTALSGADAVLIGPGMEQSGKSVEMLWSLLENCPKLVLDAGAIRVLAKYPEETLSHLKERNRQNLPRLILTPHPGEFKQLMPDQDPSERIRSAKMAAERFGAIMILKGAGTVIADPDGRTYVNTSGSSAMAKGGSGDVLSGMLVAFLAQGASPIDASVFAVYFHGLCGDLAACELGEYAVIPSDLVQRIPEAFRVLQNEGLRAAE